MLARVVARWRNGVALSARRTRGRLIREGLVQALVLAAFERRRIAHREWMTPAAGFALSPERCGRDRQRDP